MGKLAALGTAVDWQRLELDELPAVGHLQKVELERLEGQLVAPRYPFRQVRFQPEVGELGQH